jgi:hypothetical protein
LSSAEGVDTMLDRLLADGLVRERVGGLVATEQPYFTPSVMRARE